MPKGTCKNTGSRVYLRREDEKLIVQDMDNHTLVTRYIPAGKGVKVINNCKIRSKADGDSGPRRTVIPVEAGQ